MRQERRGVLELIMMGDRKDVKLYREGGEAVREEGMQQAGVSGIVMLWRPNFLKNECIRSY